MKTEETVNSMGRCFQWAKRQERRDRRWAERRLFDESKEARQNETLDCTAAGCGVADRWRTCRLCPDGGRGAAGAAV